MPATEALRVACALLSERRGHSGLLDGLVSTAPAVVDLTDPRQEKWAMDAAEALESELLMAHGLRALGDLVAEEDLPVAVGLALKLAHSRCLLREVASATHVSVVLAVYKENIRILSAAEHPHGEDFLRRKLLQLSWLFEGTPHTWDLVVVDDGCPEGSGRLAERILDEAGLGRKARVLFLEEAIERKLPPVAALRSTADSRKGGSIRYGLWDAARRSGPDAVLLFTDADLSTHLGQCGLLVGAIERGAAAAIGSRREPTSVVVRQGRRDQRGKLFIYLWKRLVPQLDGIVDTQCGFKAFRARALDGWFESAVESGFAFDIEMLIRVQLDQPDAISKVPIAWIDSDALSTTADLEPYLDMLRMVVRLYRTYLPETETSDSFGRLIEALDDASFDRLLRNIPPAIATAAPVDLESLASVSAAELERRAGLVA